MSQYGTDSQSEIDADAKKLANRIIVVFVVLTVLFCAGLIGGGYWYVTSQQAAQPEVRPAPTQEAAVVVIQTDQPVLPTATQVIVGQTVQSQATATPYQPVENWPPENDTRPVLIMAGNAFSSYFTGIQVEMMDNPERSYRFEFKPYNFVAEDGTLLNPAEEIDQANELKDGTIDLLANTPDILVNNDTGGEIIAEIDRSDGADLTAMWPEGRTEGCKDNEDNPKKLNIFNDLKGCVIAVARQTVGKYQALSFMKLTALTPNDIALAEYDTVEDAVVAFVKGEADAVSAWTGPSAIDRALEAGGKEILNSHWLRTIRDDLIVSANANENKKDLVFEFLIDWFRAMKYQQENPEEAYELIANWKYQGNNTNDWTGVYPGSAHDDMVFWMEDQVAQAPLETNLELFNEGLPDFYDRLINLREVWAWGGQEQYQPFNAADLVEPIYMQRLSQYVQDHPELFPTFGELIDTNYSPFREEGIAPSAEQLVQLPTVAEFGCSQFNFSAGEVVIEPGTESYDAFFRCAESLAQLAQYSDVDFLVVGSAARPTFYTDERSMNFAKRRAMGVFNALLAAGVPEGRTAVSWQIGPPSDDEEVREASRWVKIFIKLPAG